jgi:hypothetical protein
VSARRVPQDWERLALETEHNPPTGAKLGLRHHINSTAVVGGATSFRMDSEKSCRCRPPILAPKTVELKQGGLLLGSERSPHKQLLFNLILNGPKPLFGADGSVSPVLNLSHHLMCSIFGCSEFHGKLVCQTHSAIAVFFRQARRRSDLRNDGLPRIV